MKTLVVGASTKPERYAYQAITLLKSHGYSVVAIANKPGTVDGVEFVVGMPPLEDIHTITLYINPNIQKEYIDYLLSLHPQRIIFNPGTENSEFSNLAKTKGIESLEACTLVMLRTGQYEDSDVVGH